MFSISLNILFSSSVSIIIIETDEEERERKELEKIDLELYDVRKYGRVKLLFLRERG